MADFSIGLSILFGIFLVFFAYLGFSYRTTDEAEFHTVNRRAGAIRIIASLFTVVGASEFVIFTTLAFVFGWQSIWFFVGTLGGFLTLALFAGRIRKDAASLDHHSIPDFAATRQYTIVAALLSFSSWAFTFALVLMQIIIGGSLISQITNLPLEISAAAISVAVGFYLVFGGYRALLNTDVIQGLILFVITVFFAFLIGQRVGFDPQIIVGPGTELAIDVTVFAIGGFFAITGGPEIWQRILTSKSTETASRSLAWSGIIMFLWGVALIYGALAIRAIMPDANPDNAFLEFLSTQIGTVGLGFITLMLIAALMSTADTELFAGVVILQKALKRGGEQLTIGSSQFLIVLFVALAYVASTLTQDLINLYLAIVYLTFVTGPVGLSLVLGRGNRWSYRIGVSTAVIILLVLYTGKNLLSWYPLLILLPAFLPIVFRGDKHKSLRAGTAET